MALPGRREQALKAQEMLMVSIAKVLGYWQEGNPNPFHDYSTGEAAPHLTEEEMAEFGQILQREANRVARMFGYDKAWVS